MVSNKGKRYYFRADNDEELLIEKKFSNSGLSSKSDFFRRMILNEYIITANGKLHFVFICERVFRQSGQTPLRFEPLLYCLPHFVQV